MMKKTVVPLALSAVLAISGLVSACDADGIINLGSPPGETVTREEDFTDFTKVDVGSAFEVNITKSDNFSVIIHADESLIDYVEVSKTGSELEIYLKPEHTFTDFTLGAKKLQAEITMPELEELEISGASSGTVSGFESTSDFKLTVSGASELEMIGFRAGETDFGVSGASRVSGNLTADDFDVELSGASTIELTGEADELSIDVSGASRLDFSDFIVNEARIELSGASEATLNVKENIDVSLSGASRFYFYGNPEMGDIDVSGASTIKHK